jgi:hypothetical protein
MTGSATVCCVDCINCTAVDGWKKCTEGMAVATECVQKWCYSGRLEGVHRVSGCSYRICTKMVLQRTVGRSAQREWL